MRLMLGVSEVVFIEVEGGQQLQLACHRDEDGGLYVHLGGRDCDLEGEEPGMYYVKPHTDLTDLQRTQRLRAGDACEFRFPAKPGWRPGKVKRNGGSGYWEVWDDESGDLMHGLYIEHVRAVGTDPWGERDNSEPGLPGNDDDRYDESAAGRGGA